MNLSIVVVPSAVLVASAVSFGGGVCTPPSVSEQSRSFAACPQTVGQLMVEVSGTGPFQYEWRRYPRVGTGGAISIPNSNSSTLSIPFALLSDAGEYDCIITNGCGTVTTPRYRFAVLAGDRGSTGGIQGSDNQVTSDDFIVYINQFFNDDIRADIGSTGGTALPDGELDANDFIVFIDLYFNFPGCP